MTVERFKKATDAQKAMGPYPPRIGKGGEGDESY